MDSKRFIEAAQNAQTSIRLAELLHLADARIAELEGALIRDDERAKYQIRIAQLEAALREIAVSQPNSSHKHNPDYFAGPQFGIDTLAGFARKALDPQSESASITRSDIKVSDNGTTSCDYTLEREVSK